MWNKEGEHAFFFETKAGQMEASLTMPSSPKPFVAILGHPHPLYDGNMNNKVVTTMVRAFKEANIPTVRFNFRGAGLSQGSHAHGEGESDDMLELSHQILKEQPNVELIYGGFSFGSFVAGKTASKMKHRGLLLIAPPVSRYDFQSIRSQFHCPMIFMGDKDEVVEPESVFHFAETPPPIPLVCFKGVGHFFHGHLTHLKASVSDFIQSLDIA